MATQKLNAFIEYELSEKEQLFGSIFSQEQKMVLQNQRALIAQQILNLESNTINHLEFIKQEAFLKGQLAALTYLFDCDEVATQAAQAQAAPQSDS